MASSHRRRPVPALVGDRQADAEALDMKVAGLPYREIAKRQGCDVHTAHDRVQRALASIVPTDKVEELRKIENDRLNAAVLTCVEIISGRTVVEIEGREVAIPHSAEERLAAVGRLTKLSERIAKLNGLDIPVVQKVEVTTVDRLDEQIEQLMEELGRTGEGAAPGPAEG